MPNDRIASLRNMLERSPDDPRVHFGLALEHEKRAQWADAASHLRRYLQLTSDEGNAWGRLGQALRHLGQQEQARDAYRQGIEAALKHGHPAMAAEFEDVLEEWGS